MKSGLVRVLGQPATLIHGDTLVLDRWRWLTKYLRKISSGSKSLIDVGCGTGAFTIGAARRGYKALGLSWDTRNQRVAAERAAICRADLARFEVQDVRTLGERGDLQRSFDVAICFECIEHVLDDEKLMRSIADCLKPGGVLYLTTPNFDFRPMTYDDDAISSTEDGGHVRRGYRPADLERLCAQSSLDVLKIEYCSGVLSQKITGISRIMSRHLPHLVVWALILPLRCLPPLFDGLASKMAKWPGYSITLVASKRAAGV